MNKFESLNLESKRAPEEELLSVAHLKKYAQSIREVLNPKEDPERAEQTQKLVDLKIQHLKEVYPDYRFYQTFYILNLQPVPDIVTRVDFPDEDSVLAFIESL